MRVIVAGSRTVTDYEFVRQAIIDSGMEITEVVSGGARGVDRLGERYASEQRLPCKIFPADWQRYGRGAGLIRNQEMAEYADALIAIPVPAGRGTQDMIRRATKLGLRVFVREYQAKEGQNE